MFYILQVSKKIHRMLSWKTKTLYIFMLKFFYLLRVVISKLISTMNKISFQTSIIKMGCCLQKCKFCSDLVKICFERDSISKNNDNKKLSFISLIENFLHKILYMNKY